MRLLLHPTPYERTQLCITCDSGVVANLLCDWKLGEGRTCDRPICAKCSAMVGPGKDLCPEHALAFERWLRRRASDE